MLFAGLTTLCAPAPALAQKDADENSAPAAATEKSEARVIDFEADTVEYLEDDDTIIARGNVVMRSEGESVRADSVTWNRNQGIILADGNVRLLDKDGNQLFTERVELTDEFKAGAMDSMLLALRQGGRLAANSGDRSEDGNVILSYNFV